MSRISCGLYLCDPDDPYGGEGPCVPCVLEGTCTGGGGGPLPPPPIGIGGGGGGGVSPGSSGPTPIPEAPVDVGSPIDDSGMGPGPIWSEQAPIYAGPINPYLIIENLMTTTDGMATGAPIIIWVFAPFWSEGAGGTQQSQRSSVSANPMAGIGPDPLACSAYLDGTGAGQILFNLCSKVFPNGAWSNCVRGKLLNQYVRNGNPLDLSIYLFWDHPKDFASCLVQ